mgnify:CR=1 FL=1
MTPLEIADIIGIISFALSGFLIAVHHKLDVLGIVITAFLTALGGGMVRDIIANKTPYIFTQNLPVTLVICTVIVAILFELHHISDLEGKTTFIISDTIGLVSFSITGALVALEADFNFFGVLLLSLMTAIGGGTLRDIIVNRMPAFLISDFYGSVALIIATVIYTLNHFDEMTFLSLLITFVLGVLLRLLAHYKQWHLPKLT